MMKILKNVLPKSAIIFLIFTVICGVVYTGIVTGIAQLIFPDKANGSSKCSESQFDVGRYPVTSALKRFQTSANLYTILISKQTYLRPFNTNKDRVKAI